MPTSFLEIVELADGRIALRRADDEQALVTLEFSADAKAFLHEQHIEVAKAMCKWPGAWPKVSCSMMTLRRFCTESAAL